jgi:hypothetical protein
MAGSAMVFTETIHTSVRKIVAAWTSDNATGAVSGNVIFGASYNANETTARINLECDQI